MKNMRHILFFLLLLVWTMDFGFCQEEESAEVFLEEYTDQFQENFFEALKQKGIENYDKAINLLLECKRLDEQNRVIDHELAKVYLADKQLVKAQAHAIESVISDPSNRWYLNTLFEILKKQGRNLESLKAQIPLENNSLKENLALIYYENKEYEAAMKVLKELKQTAFSETLSLKIKDSLQKQREPSREVKPTEAAAEENSLRDFMARIKDLIGNSDFSALQELSSEALETYPSQPYFYYANGLALNKKGMPKQAIESLETALDYLLDDTALANKIYSELAACHNALGNSSKANMYLSKIKPGS